jgi:REP element-mobilizing transposase RayT
MADTYTSLLYHIVFSTKNRASIITKDIKSPLYGLIKTNSSKWLNESVVSDRFQWQTGYGAFTVGKSMLADVSRYIRNQPGHHREHTLKEEFIRLLELNDIDYDEKYLWV